MQKTRLKCLDCNVTWHYKPTGNESIDAVHRQCCICESPGREVSHQTRMEEIIERYLNIEKQEIEREVIDI